MSSQNMVFGAIVVLFFLYMAWKKKPKQPTALNMKKRSTQAHSNLKRIEGARWVEAEILGDEGDSHGQSSSGRSSSQTPSSKSSSKWAHPVVLIHGKYVDAYSVIGLNPGATEEQVRKRVEELLQSSAASKLSSSKIEQIRQAYQAIIDGKRS